MRTIYMYTYRSMREGDKFKVVDFETEEEDLKFLNIENYGFVDSSKVGDISCILDESFGYHINFDWFSFENTPQERNRFKQGVIDLLNKLIDSHLDEVDTLNSMIANVKMEG